MIIQRYYAADLLPFQEKAWKAIDGLFVLYADHLAALAEKDEEIKRQALSLKRENAEWAEDVRRLTKTIKYLCGIAVKGEGREINEDETVEQFVLSYVKKCEQQIDALTAENASLKEKREIWEERNVSLETKYADLTAERDEYLRAKRENVELLKIIQEWKKDVLDLTAELSKSALREKILAEKWGKECLELGMEKETLTAENERLRVRLRTHGDIETDREEAPQSNEKYYECPACGSAVPHGMKCHHNL